MKAPAISLRKLAYAVLLSTAAPAANANQCGDISPLFSQLGEQYYVLENIPQSELSKQSVKANDLIKTLKSKSFRAGLGERTRCFGTSQPREQVSKFVLESFEIASTNSFNELVLKAYEYDTEDKFSHRETVFIPLSQNSTSLVGNHGLTANQRHRQAINSRSGSTGPLRGTHLREISTTASRSHAGVEINQSVYVNGQLAEWFTWTLN